MMSETEGVPAGDVTELTAEKPKIKARKKKAAEVVEASEPAAATETAPKTTKAKAAKKAASKAAKPVEPVTEPIVVIEAEPVAKKPAKKAAKKAAKKTVSEPAGEGAEELVAEPVSAAEETGPEPAPGLSKHEPKLERLQKILAKAGISSRRKAEELILGGQVQINGKVVTELGTKADPERDHVRVDGKLLQGPERIRYFALNKPKGFVTTVSDPEGRPTVMQFFAAERERLYPVGRLDYLSEGLLLVTNDGELANKLTKAASGVEKTYLVKVAGQPSEEMLDALRAGVVIERGRPGTHSGRVRTAPAKIRQVRQGDNPWYEVIVIEGRNRELRKMFEEIGHHVEKIRRVGYGPLILDLEPGKLRELEPEEVHALRLASEGKLKTRRRRGPQEAQLPTVAGKTVRYKKADGKPGYEPRTMPQIRPEFQQESKREFNPAFKTAFRPDFKPSRKPEFEREATPGAQPSGRPAFRPEFKGSGKPEFRSKPGFKAGPGGGFKTGGRPAFGSKPRRAEPPVTDYVLPPRKAGPPEPEIDERTPPRQRPDFNPDYKPGFQKGAKPAFRSGKPGSKPAFRADGPPKRFESRDSAPRSSRPDKPFKPANPRAEGTRPLGRYNPADDDFVPRKTPGFRVEPVEDKPRVERPRSGGFDRAGGSGRPFRPAAGRPATSGDRPFRPNVRPGSSSERPARFAPRTDGPPIRRSKPFDSGHDRGEERPREFRPRTDRPARSGDGPPKKFSSERPARPSGDGKARPAPGRSGPDGEPRVKERWRNSFTGKNKGRPKPKKAE